MYHVRLPQLKYVQKMLEQMLAQFSYANFAYGVMSEMEPYLSELFIQLQVCQPIGSAILVTLLVHKPIGSAILVT